MIRFDGASFGAGFSTISVSQNNFPFRSPIPTTPYMCTRSRGTSSTAMTFAGGGGGGPTGQSGISGGFSGGVSTPSFSTYTPTTPTNFFTSNFNGAANTPRSTTSGWP